MDNSTPTQSGPMMLVPFVENVFLLKAYLHRASMTGLLLKHQKEILQKALFYAELDASYSPAYLGVNAEVSSRLRQLMEEKPIKETEIGEILDRAFDLAKQLLEGTSSAMTKRQPFFDRVKMMFTARHQEHRIKRRLEEKQQP